MTKFLHGNELNYGINQIITGANELLLIVSPYIKLHHRYKESLKTKIHDDKLKIILVFGKNDSSYNKSMAKEDFKFFADFPNIEIRYENRLHAKFYANEHSSLLTSMNLYDYSQNENIEAGFFIEAKTLNSFINNKSLDEQAFHYFLKVSENSKLLFKKEPQYIKSIMGIKKKYSDSLITKNLIKKIIPEKKEKISIKIPKSNNKSILKQVQPNEEKRKDEGFCIRCNKSITLDPRYPYCNDCFKSWVYFQNEEFPEKHCHICGEKKPDINKTKPTCYSCFKEYRNKLNFNIPSG